MSERSKTEIEDILVEFYVREALMRSLLQVVETPDSPTRSNRMS